MGTWGVNLFQDDIAEDVRSRYKELLREYSDEESFQRLLIEFRDVINDPEDSTVFWLSLSDTQWTLGRLNSYVKKKAIEVIDTKQNLALWHNTEEKTICARQAVLEKLKKKISSTQPPIKEIKKLSIYQCKWNIGDVFAYPLESEYAKEAGLSGEHILLYKISETVFYPGHTIPVVWLKVSKELSLPKNVEEFNLLDFVEISTLKYESDRLWIPDVRTTIEEQIHEKERVKVLADENGFLHVYRVCLLNTSRKIIPKKLVYIGNFINANPPEKEFVPCCFESLQVFSWKLFESNVIDRYSMRRNKLTDLTSNEQ